MSIKYFWQIFQKSILLPTPSSPWAVMSFLYYCKLLFVAAVWR